MVGIPRIGVMEREVMRVTFEAEEVMPVNTVAEMAGCSIGQVYATYKKYGVSIPKTHGIGNFRGNAKSPEVERQRREKIATTLTGRAHTDERRSNISKAKTGKPHRQPPHKKSTKEKLRNSTIRAYAEERLFPTGVRSKGAWYMGIRMRSGLEAEFARQLDEAGIPWQYEPKTFKLSWCTYRPDFYLPETDTWVECKGYMDEVSQRKVDSFRIETGKTLAVVWWSEVMTQKRTNEQERKRT